MNRKFILAKSSKLPKHLCIVILAILVFSFTCTNNKKVESKIEVTDPAPIAAPDLSCNEVMFSQSFIDDTKIDFPAVSIIDNRVSIGEDKWIDFPKNFPDKSSYNFVGEDLGEKFNLNRINETDIVMIQGKATNDATIFQQRDTFIYSYRLKQKSFTITPTYAGNFYLRKRNNTYQILYVEDYPSFNCGYLEADFKGVSDPLNEIKKLSLNQFKREGHISEFSTRLVNTIRLIRDQEFLYKNNPEDRINRKRYLEESYRQLKSQLQEAFYQGATYKLNRDTSLMDLAEELKLNKVKVILKGYFVPERMDIPKK